MFAAVPDKNSNILTEQDYSTSKLRSSSSFFLSRLSSSLACSLRPGLTSSAPPSGCCKPGTWVREGFSCCLEGVVEAQTLWAGAAAVLREIEADEIPRKKWKSNKNLHPNNRVVQPATFAPLTSFAIKFVVLVLDFWSPSLKLEVLGSKFSLLLLAPDAVDWFSGKV